MDSKSYWIGFLIGFLLAVFIPIYFKAKGGYDDDLEED